MRASLTIALCAACLVCGSASAQTDAEKVLGDKINAAIQTCAAAYLEHRITTHADAAICASGPVTKAFQDAGFPDMDLVFEFESASLDGASKLDHGQITESDFRTAIMQAVLKLKADEVPRAEKRAQALAAQQQVQFQQAQAQAAQEQASAEWSAAKREAQQERRQAAMQQIIRNQQIEEEIQQRNTAAFMNVLGGLGRARPAQTNCVTMFSGSLASTNCN